VHRIRSLSVLISPSGERSFVCSSDDASRACCSWVQIDLSESADMMNGWTTYKKRFTRSGVINRLTPETPETRHKRGNRWWQGTWLLITMRCPRVFVRMFRGVCAVVRTVDRARITRTVTPIQLLTRMLTLRTGCMQQVGKGRVRIVNCANRHVSIHDLE
jgi:hypothetical protein